MPWSTSSMSELRTAFVQAVRTAGQPVTQAARAFGISRKTAYKWLARFDRQQPLADRSRKPDRSPARTIDSLEQAVLAVRDQYGWGPRKIVAYLRNRDQPAPPVRTAAAILHRHHRIPTAPAPEPTECQRFERPEPNQLWQLDFKGWIEIERRRISPLTILDDHSRFLLALHPCTDLTLNTAWTVLWQAFGDYGLPDAVRCDNAFGTNVSHRPGLSWFEARLLRLGIRTIHGRPYHPQTQGKVERLHGTRVREVYPALDTRSLTQFTAGLDHWRVNVYNCVRPHEALGDQAPLTRWRPSPRQRPHQLPDASYPLGSSLRRVGSNGTIRYRVARILVGQGLVGESVRIEQVDGCLVIFSTTQAIRRLPLDGLKNSGIL